MHFLDLLNLDFCKLENYQKSRLAVKKHHHNSQGNKQNKSDWEQQFLIKSFNPFVVAYLDYVRQYC